MAFGPGYGATFKRGANTVGQVVSIKPPAIQQGTAETTHLTSTARTFINTIDTLSEAQITIEYDPSDAEHQNLISDATGATSQSFTVTFADAGAATWVFTAFVTSFDPQELTVDNVIRAVVTLRPTGVATITP